MNYAKYISVAQAIKDGDTHTKAAYWMGVLDGVITTVIIAVVVLAVMS